VKKTLVIVFILLAFIAGYMYYNKPQPAQYRGASYIKVVKIANDAAEVRGDLVFHNPNKMRTQLGKVNFDVLINNISVGHIQQDFSTAIKADEDFHFTFQTRFELTDSLRAELPERFPVSITGTAGSDVWFANYTFPINSSDIVTNTLK
jgi:LEA14-like dessication related protein